MDDPPGAFTFHCIIHLHLSGRKTRSVKRTELVNVTLLKLDDASFSDESPQVNVTFRIRRSCPKKHIIMNFAIQLLLLHLTEQTANLIAREAVTCVILSVLLSH